MNSCKNCGKEYEKNNVYCSYKCRNIYVNKNLRDYSKNNNSVKKKNSDVYNKNPKYCKNCNEKIVYSKKQNDFCNGSCSATYINKHRSKLIYSEDGLKSLRESQKRLTEERFPEIKLYGNDPNKCEYCCGKLSYKKRKNRFCSKECRNKFQEKNLNKYQKYYRDSQFKFSLKDYPNEFNFGLIEEHGWYSAANRGNNLYGVSRDHIFSIKEGFRQNIPAELIAHPANCQLMLQSDNVSKFDKADLTEEELRRKINDWNLKYRDS
jgi:predicted nucleic acid-binding Zn ribbon protein